jgi:hypothetical protein
MADDDNAAGGEDAAMEEKMSGMSDVEKRLFRIRMKMNQGRKANKAETEVEFKRLTDPKYDSKQRYKEKKEAALLNEEEFQAPKSKEEELLNVTAEDAERYKEKLEEKRKTEATWGWKAFTADADYRAYNKTLGKLPKNRTSSSSSAGAESGEYDEMEYGKTGTMVSSAGLERLSKDINEKEEKRMKHSRRRATLDPVGSDSINDKNEFFNKKIKRSFDKYTVEIRQNLERGTAL